MMMKSRDVPVEFAHGWGGGFGGCPPMFGFRCSGAPVAMAYRSNLGIILFQSV